ncbi:MAG: hypothetical protein JWR80_9286 [Bradyrhizobium sp.]|nr:hypothetical protein [Bradyrhizobium sp.]
MATIVGVADTPVGVTADLGATELYAAATRDAADVGATMHDIDFCLPATLVRAPNLYHARAMAEYFIRPLGAGKY